MTTDAAMFRNKVRAGDLYSVRKMLAEGVDYSSPGKTMREWTPLHTACWGTAKPNNDREIIEAILTMASKKKGEEEKAKNAKDAVDGSTPLDLAKERRDAIGASSGDEQQQLEEKRAARVRHASATRLAVDSLVRLGTLLSALMSQAGESPADSQAEWARRAGLWGGRKSHDPTPCSRTGASTIRSSSGWRRAWAADAGCGSSCFFCAESDCDIPRDHVTLSNQINIAHILKRP